MAYACKVKALEEQQRKEAAGRVDARSLMLKEMLEKTSDARPAGTSCEWVIREESYSRWRARMLVGLHKTYRYTSTIVEVMHNGFVESFNGPLRDERLNEHLLTNFKGNPSEHQRVEDW